MKSCSVAIVRDRNGIWPIVVGYPNTHWEDWRGDNTHMINLPGWRPHRRLEDTDDNRDILYALMEAVDKEKLEKFMRRKTGTWMPHIGIDIIF